MIAEVVFDLPLPRPFAYAVPSGMELRPGQRVTAPLRNRARVGVVVETRYGDERDLKPIETVVDRVPILSHAALQLGRWTARQSLSSWGSTLLSLVPPPARRSSELVAPAAEPRAAPAPVPQLWVGARRHARLVKQLAHGGSALVVAPD